MSDLDKIGGVPVVLRDPRVVLKTSVIIHTDTHTHNTYTCSWSTERALSWIFPAPSRLLPLKTLNPKP